MRTLWIKDPYLQQILTGRKTVEVRVGYPNIRKLRAGDHVLLNDQHEFEIVRITHYPDFPALLAREDPARIAPQTPPEGLLAALRAVYPPAKEALGAVAIELADVAR